LVTQNENGCCNGVFLPQAPPDWIPDENLLKVGLIKKYYNHRDIWNLHYCLVMVGQIMKTK
jgi:hypothetical protein